MKIYTTNQVKQLDAYTIEHEPISSIDLMERASKAFVVSFKQKITQDCKLVVIAGHGNNGGDALTVARTLAMVGYKVEAYLYNPQNKLSADCEVNKQRLANIHSVKFTEYNDFTVLPELDDTCVVIDGLFGSGLNKPLVGEYEQLIQHINRSPAKVVSIDIPSGLFGEDNSENNLNAIVCADWTLTFQFPKLSFLFPENEKYVGKWEVIDIGLHKDALNNTQTPYWFVQKEDIAPLLKKRDRFAHKGNFGHALLIAGGYGKMGAAVLAARACLRTGVGLLTVRVPKHGLEIMQVGAPEAMVTLSDEDNFDFMGIGPGIGTEVEMAERLFAFLQSSENPMVLDADALNILASSPEQMGQIPAKSILTPHPKEFDRLVGASSSSYERLNKAINLAVERQVYIVLKGAYTATCTPKGSCFFNSTGNPGMATGGSGDVLTGILLSLLTQGYTPEEVAKIGVYLHGMAGDRVISSGKQSQESLLAGDLIEAIGACFNLLREEKEKE